MKLIFQFFSLTSLLILSSCAHHNGCARPSSSNQCEMHKQKEKCNCTQQCDMKKEEHSETHEEKK